LPSAPFTLAIASVVVAEEPIALAPTAPPALTFGPIDAVTLSSTIANANAKPIATDAPATSAFAVVVTAAVCVALSVTAPEVISD
jgi:hypothetical protein